MTLTAQIERPIEVNGVLFDALARAAQSTDIAGAQKLLSTRLDRSRIYQVVNEPDCVGVFSRFHNHVLAIVSEA